MDQHPVPRNISGFQFHLIGDMTLKQFGYLAAGAIMAFVIYKIIPLPQVAKYILMAASAGIGLVFAFVPIQDRPMDKWLAIFIKSIYSPTQYLWQKEGTVPEILTKPAVARVKTLSSDHIEAHNDARQKLNSYLKTLPSQPHQTLNTKEKSYIDKTLSLFDVSPVVTTATDTIASQPPMTPPVLRSPIAKEVQNVSTPQKPPEEQKPEIKSTKVKQEETKEKEGKNKIHQETKKELSSLMEEKKALEEQLQTLKQKLKTEVSSHMGVKKEEEKPPKEAEVKKEETKKPKTIKDIGMPILPQTPNIVVGVVKDVKNKLLPNIIITIKDKKGTPQRALKTNKLGQFVAATPLSNGDYLIEVEDPLKRYIFDIIKITLDGNIFNPVEIIAKGEKEIIREKLTKEIFGNPTAS